MSGWRPLCTSWDCKPPLRGNLSTRGDLFSLKQRMLSSLKAKLLVTTVLSPPGSGMFSRYFSTSPRLFITPKKKLALASRGKVKRWWWQPILKLQGKSFKKWTLDRVKGAWGLAKTAKPFVLQQSPISTRDYTLIISCVWLMKIAFNLGALAKESNKRVLINPVLAILPLTNPSLLIDTEVELLADNAISHGFCDFVVGNEAQNYFFIVEAKAQNLNQGLAQNLLQLECAFQIEHKTLYGAATDGTSWIFLRYDGNVVHQSPIITDTRLILGTLAWLANVEMQLMR